MKWLKTPVTAAAVLTTKILFIALRCACSPVVLTGSPSNTSCWDFTKIIMLAEGKAHFSEDATRVWVTIVELQTEDWSIGGHTDWLRDYESALNTLGTDLALK